MMEVILLERIETLGQMGDTVKVKPGYARNYLLPQRKALRANKENKAYFEKKRATLEADNLKKKQEAETVAARMKAVEPVMIRQAGDNGQLYGSVTARDIADSLSADGIKVGRKQILLDRSIKMLGIHPCRIALHAEVIVEMTLNIARSAEEAVTQKEEARQETQSKENASKETAPEDMISQETSSETTDQEPPEKARADSKNGPGTTTETSSQDQATH